jgi:hypothetical protein
MTLVPRSFTLTLPPGNCTLTPAEGGGGSGCRQPTIPKSASQSANTSGVFTPLLSFARDKWQPVERLSLVSASARKELNDKVRAEVTRMVELETDSPGTPFE